VPNYGGNGFKLRIKNKNKKTSREKFGRKKIC
jgi:hypothetical protein